jgi:DNA-binding Xre family transcriptional regulator
MIRATTMVRSTFYYGLEAWNMTVSYDKLWHLLIDRKLKKKDVCAAAGISTAVMAKLGRGENVNTVTLTKICEALNCDIGDIIELGKTRSADYQIVNEAYLLSGGERNARS